MIQLATAVHSAFRGYAWSRIPTGLTERLLDQMREIAAAKRGDFPDPNAVDRGVVALGPVAAAFAIRNVPDWDSNGRASEYSAFAFFKASEAGGIDFAKLLAHPFFAAPVREPPESIDCPVGAAAPAPLTAAGQLVCHQQLKSLPAEQGGNLLAGYFSKSNQWCFRLENDGTMSVECAEWNRK